MKVQFGERKLQEWADAKSVNLSKAGANWLVAALDPYHDQEIPSLEGWPDVSTAASVVSCVKQTMQVSATSGGGAPVANNWDCHVALVPDLQASACLATTARKGNVFTWNNSSSPSTPFGGLMARAQFTSGAAVDWFAAAGLNTDLGKLTLNSTYGSGLSRVIGIGFEVHNTTADLYKQGSVVYYRQPEPKRLSDYWTGTDTGDSGTLGQYSFTGTPVRVPPTTTADAMQLAGSREFKAKDGAYIVAAFHSNENPPLPVGYSQPIWFQSGDEDQLLPTSTTSTNNSQVRLPAVNVSTIVLRGTNSYTDWTAPSKKLYPFHQCGCIFSGLSPQTTLTINMIVYVESFPPVNTPLTVLATPSARYDPMALEIYSKALTQLPVGVPVRENGLGQWFSDVISDIEPFLTPMMTMLHPVAGAISKGVGVANQMYRQQNAPGPSLLPAPKQKKKVQKKNLKLQAGNRGKKNNVQGPLKKP